MPPALSLILSAVLIPLVAFGFAWPIASRLRLDLPGKLLAALILSVLGVYLFGWVHYVAAWPGPWLWVLPALTVVGLAGHAKTLRIAAADPTVRALLIAQLLVSASCLGWLALVKSYSGGGWAGDWFEHWERACFFLEHWPQDHKFLTIYPVTARPPLTNVVTGVFLGLFRVDFAHYQLVSTLLASLAFMPAALLAHRFGGRPAIPLLAVLFIVNPLFVQNATFAWTKLPAACFVLASLYFFLVARDAVQPVLPATLSATALAAGLLAHYSAAPYLLVLAPAWFVLGWPYRRSAAWWRATGLATLAALLVLTTWFAWSFATYGSRGTLLANTTVSEQAPAASAQAVKIALNLRDSIVPFFLRDSDQAFLAQRSPWGWWRDQFFQGYQLNFFLAFGSVAWLALLGLLARAARTAGPTDRRFWAAFIGGTFFLGIAAHGARDTWGLTHICLQPLILLGLAFLAAKWPDLGRGWRLALLAGAVIDLFAGIVLHFAVQNFALDRWLTPGREPADVFTSYNAIALMNLRAKLQSGFIFFGDAIAAPAVLVLALLFALLMVALHRVRSAAP